MAMRDHARSSGRKQVHLPSERGRETDGTSRIRQWKQ